MQIEYLSTIVINVRIYIQIYTKEAGAVVCSVSGISA